jgi:hypothetical protein
MFGISCPSISLCVAVGGNNTIASTTDPAGGLADWKVVYAGSGALPTKPNSIFPGRQIRGISCPSARLCVAATLEGNIYTATDPTGNTDAWSVADIDGEGPNTHFYGVSCASPTLCVAVADNGRIFTSEDPTGGPATWSAIQLAESLQLRGISCASRNLCVAVGDFGEIVVSSNPTEGASEWRQVISAVGESHLFGVSCVVPLLCVTGNAGGNLITSINPTAVSPHWEMTPGGASVQITAASCVSSNLCAATDSNGDVLSSRNPVGGPGAWSLTNILPYPGVDETAPNHLFGISCPSPSLCVVAGNRGQIFTSEDPFAQSPIPIMQGDKKKRPRPKRPRTMIAQRPPPGVVLHHRTAKVQFRFFARNHAQVRGFVCQLDRRPLKRCRSPKRYRVGLGRHVLRVRAIGWTGLKGPPARARFEVCEAQSLPFCIG